jgi:YebC/PmpR family DNA-binding regulatory protein
MSGHSKWSTIKRQKAATDAKRGAIFTKLANAISLAAKTGADPEMNPALRSAIDQARAANMPKANIEKAIKKGSGELGGAQIEELYYEGMGPANIQFIVKCLTDNKNRSASNVRHLFNKYGGSFASVMWNFDFYGLVLIDQENLKDIDLDDLELELIDLDIVDFKKEEEGVSIITLANKLNEIVAYLEEKNIKISSAQLEYIAKEKQVLSTSDKDTVSKFIDELEENEDVNSYYHNYED